MFREVVSIVRIQLNSVITSLKGQNVLCPSKKYIALSEVCVKVKEKYFKTKYRPASMLLNL